MNKQTNNTLKVKNLFLINFKMLLKRIRNKLEKSCKICADTECINDTWIKPCGCKGSLLWCHENCLKTWIKYSDSKCCNICKKSFHIEYKNPYLIYVKKYVPYITYQLSIFLLAYIVFITSFKTKEYFIITLAIIIRKFLILVYLYYVLIYYLIKSFNKDIIGQLEFHPFSFDYLSDFLLVLSEIHKINKLVIFNKFLRDSSYKILNYESL